MLQICPKFATCLRPPPLYIRYFFKHMLIYYDRIFLGESIPIRLFLSGYELTPTMRDINKKFSVRYFLNLVLVDEEERRYFKQQVINSLIFFLCLFIEIWLFFQ